MYREEPGTVFPDSGWRFLAGDEDEAYINDPDNLHIFSLNTISNYDSDIIAYLHSEVGCAFIRTDNKNFEPDDGTKAVFICKHK